jgi:predicted dehydrogenase
MKKVKWGVLGVASIATRKVIPGIRKGELGEVAAIASRDLRRAEQAAQSLGIPRAFGTYEDLLKDAHIDAVYIPLPNHLHVPWSIRAMEAGKHVLCEKPIARNAAEARTLLPVRDRTGVKIGEAFMVKTHPQCLRTHELIQSGRIGKLRAIAGVFSYFNRDPQNVRQNPAWGGGGLLDIGCYPIFISRWMFGAEPLRATAVLEFDPDFGIDRLTSGLMEFPQGHASFTCSTQALYHQRMHFFGDKGRIEVLIPFNAPLDGETRILVDDCRDLAGGGAETIVIPACDQYTLQADAFARAIRGAGDVQVPIESAIGNMEVIDAMFRANGRTWETVRG